MTDGNTVPPEGLAEEPLHVEFFCPGRPAPGGSKRGFFNKKLGRVIMAPDSKGTKPWMACVSAMAHEAMAGKVQAAGPLLLWVVFRLPRPKGHYRTGRHAGELKDGAPRFADKKPDGVKLCRSTEDAMSGIVWLDDAQVCVHNISKVYADPGQSPGALVRVYRLAPTTPAGETASGSSASVAAGSPRHGGR